MGERVRGEQVRPTKAEIAGAWRRVRDRAGQGDLLAEAILIALGDGNVLKRLPGEFLQSAEVLGSAIKRRVGEVD